MGALGFNDFKNQVKFRMGMDRHPESIGTEGINYYGVWVNDAYRHICSTNRLMGIDKPVFIPHLEAKATIKTTGGVAHITEPGDCLVVRVVYDATNNRKLDYIPTRQYLEYTDREDASSEGSPTEWTRMSGRIYLHPTPAKTGDDISVHYKFLPIALSGSATTVIGAEWDEPIVQLACYKGFIWTGQFDKAKIARQEFVETAYGIVMMYRTEELDRNLKIGPTDSYM